MTATVPFRNRIALVFDFDSTLASSSYDILLEHCGVDPKSFRAEKVKPLSSQGWDDTLARFYTLVRLSRSSSDFAITRDFLAQVGRSIEPFPGVPEMFDRVRRWAAAVSKDIEVEFYLLTCGFVDMHRAMDIAGQFEEMWGSEFHFDEDGEVDFIRQMITFPEKVRYLLGLSKGLGVEGPNAPAEVYREVRPEQIHVPISQMIYIGDGGSDMPSFSLMQEQGGIAIGVYESENAEEWEGHASMRADRQVQNLARADYSPDSELMLSIRYAVESICKLVELRRLGEGE